MNKEKRSKFSDRVRITNNLYYKKIDSFITMQLYYKYHESKSLSGSWILTYWKWKQCTSGLNESSWRKVTLKNHFYKLYALVYSATGKTYWVSNTGSSTNNAPFLLQNLLLQNHKHVIL